MKKVTVVLVFLLFVGCASVPPPTFHEKYGVGLVRIERSDSAPLDIPIGEAGEDEIIKISWAAPMGFPVFTLENKTESTFKIRWDDSTYIDESGNNYRILRGNTRPFLSELSDPQFLNRCTGNGYMTFLALRVGES